MPIFVQLIQPDRMGLLCEDDGDELLTALGQDLQTLAGNDGFARFKLLDGGQSMIVPVANIAIVRYVSKEDVEKNKKETEEAKKKAEAARRGEAQSNIIKPNYVFPQGRKGRSQ